MKIEDIEVVIKANIKDITKKLEGLAGDTKKSVSQAVAPVNELEKSFSKMSETASKGIEKIKAQLVITDKQIELQRQKIERLKKAYEKQTYNPDRQAKISESIQSAEIQLDNLVEKSVALGEKLESAMDKSIGEDAKKQVENVTEEVKKAGEEVEKIKPKIRQVVVETEKATKKTTSVLSKIVSRIKTLSIAMIIRKIIRQAIQGFKDLAVYSSQFNSTISNMQSSMLQARNSITTAFAPAIQALEPIITRVAEAISKMFTYITMYSTALFTNNTQYIRAKKVTTDYAKSLDSVASAQRRVLANFDELNVLNENNGMGSSNGGVNAQDMFETVDIPQNVLDNAQKLKDIYEKIKPYLSDIAGIIAGMAIGNEIIKLSDWINKLGKTKDVTKGLTDAMRNKNSVLSEQTEETGAETSAVLKWVLALGGATAGAWAIKKAIDGIKQSFPLGLPIGEVGVFANAFSECKEKISEWITNLKTSMQTAWNYVSDGTAWNTLKSLVTNAITVSSEAIVLFKENVVLNLKTTFSKISEYAYKGLSNMWNNVKAFVINASNAFASFGTNMVSNMGKTISSWLDTFLDGLQNAWDNFVEFMGGIGEAITKFWRKNKTWVIPASIALTGVALAGVTGGASLGLTALATGGVLTKATPVLAGEYPNASKNPEIVTPQSLMYETNMKANIPVINAVEEMADKLTDALSNMKVYAEFGYDKLKVGLDNEARRVGAKVYA